MEKDKIESLNEFTETKPENVIVQNKANNKSLVNFNSKCSVILQYFCQMI